MSKFNRSKPAPGVPGKISFLRYTNKYGTFATQSLDITRSLLNSQLAKYKDGCFVEIGVFGGATLFYLAEQFPGAQIYGIDPHDKITVFNGQNINNMNKKDANKYINTYVQFRTNIQNALQKHKLSNVHYINDTSWNAYTQFADQSIDVLFIDGDHSYQGVTKDLTLFYPKMKPGGIIVMDDCDWVGVRKAVDEFVAKHNLKMQAQQSDKTKLLIQVS